MKRRACSMNVFGLALVPRIFCEAGSVEAVGLLQVDQWHGQWIDLG